MSSAAPPLSDDQVALVLRALQRPMYMFQMAAANHRPGATTTYRRALQEARMILQDPVHGPARAQAAVLAQLKADTDRCNRPVKRGDVFWAPQQRLRITVTRVARDARWADILLTAPDGAQWSKRQPLKEDDGWFPFDVQRAGADHSEPGSYTTTEGQAEEVTPAAGKAWIAPVGTAPSDEEPEWKEIGAVQSWRNG